MNHQQTAFIGQISAAMKEARELRQFMKDAARVAILTFPSLRTCHRQAPGPQSIRGS